MPEPSAQPGSPSLADGPSPMYGAGARRLQDQFDSRRLADRLLEVTLHQELNDDDLALIADQTTVWLATVDAEGWPDVSYKGGNPGFVQAVGRHELRIPIYDGNGMFRTVGNVADTARVAVLFVDTERPWRMRIHGTAAVSTDPADLARHHGAKAVVIVSIGRIFPNCGRYIHVGGEISPYVPQAGQEPPVPSWKKLPQLREVLPAADAARLDAEP
jgi:predicted pyridoxine 5'-phosphate oxidase superfamily flavin-nucleotide-binding protein